MATATPTTPEAIPAPPEPAEGDQCVVLGGVGWRGYEKMLRPLDDRSRPQMVYLDGDLYLMSPSQPHERRNERIGMIVRVMVEELDIPCEPTRETTFRLRKKKGGVQPDDSFYLANHAVIAALGDQKGDVDLAIHPPPDLAIEVVHSHKSDNAVEVFRRFGTAEIWVSEADRLRILVLGGDGQYVESATSLAFPFLAAAEVHDRATRTGYPSATRWIQDLRRWVQDALVPRARCPIQA